MKKRPSTETRRASTRTVIAVLCVVQFVDVLGVTEVLTAAPRILRSLGAGGGAASAVLTSYAVCFGGLLMLAARLGERFGHRRVLLVGIAAFAAGSLCAATAASIPALVAGRCLQGMAAAVSVPASLRLLIAATPSSAERRAAMSAWSAAGAAAGASGFVVGGALTQLAGWRVMFWVNLPLAAVIAAGVVRAVAAQRPTAAPGLDLPGGLLFSTGVAGIVLGASLLQPPSHAGPGVAAVAGGMVLLGGAARVERHTRDPLIPRQALGLPAVRAGAGASFLNTAATSSIAAIATLDLQRTQHLSAGAAGARLLPLSVGAIAGSSLATPALRRLPAHRAIALGLLLIGAADAGVIPLHRAGWLMSLPIALAGLGLGVSSVAANAWGTDVGPSLQAATAGALNTAAQLGTALGVATLLLLSGATDHASLPLHGPALGWAGAALLAIAGAMLIARRPPHPRQHDDQAAGDEVEAGLGVEQGHQTQRRGQNAGGDDAEGLAGVLHEPERREHPPAMDVVSGPLQEADPGRLHDHPGSAGTHEQRDVQRL
jgi:MFS family permease